MVILFGVIEFIIVTLFVKSIFNKKYGIQYKEKCFEIKNIDIDLFIKLSCIFFCILIFILNINFILNVTNENLGNLKEAIKNYDGMQKFSDKFIKPPKILGVSLILINAISYWFIYVIANNFVFNKKIDKLSILIVLLCMI